MADRGDLVHSAPWALTPPCNSDDSQLVRQSGEPADHARHRILALKVATLLEPLDGLELNDYERQVLSRIGCWETHTVAVLAALLRRARRASLQPARPRTIMRSGVVAGR